MSMRFRITVRGLAIELRGYLDELGDDAQPGIVELAEAMKPFGIVVASPMERTGDPWDGQPTPEKSYGLMAEKITTALANDADPSGLVHELAQIHYGQAVVIRGERERADRAEAELQARELHHFETEQYAAEAAAMADALEGNWESGDLAGAVNETIAFLRKVAS